MPFASGRGGIGFAGVDLGDGRSFDEAPVLAYDERGKDCVVAPDLASFLDQVLRGEWARKGAWATAKKASRSQALADARRALQPL